MKILNQKSFDEKLRQAATEVPEKTIEEIRNFILSADNAQLYHINPYRLAARRKLDRVGGESVTTGAVSRTGRGDEPVITVGRTGPEQAGPAG